MDDGYDGSTSGETSDVSSEAGAEVGTSEAPDAGSLTDAETASAFDEDSSEITAPDVKSSLENEKEATTETTDNVDTPDPSKGEIELAFDEEVPEKETETKVQDTKTEVAPTQPETKEGVEKNDNSETIHVNCTREDLAGKEHPETGVPYEAKVVEVNGKQLEVTVPNFDSKYDTKLENNQLQDSRQKHDDICNAKLKEHCENNPEWAKENFNSKQLDAIMNGKRPPGYTWHHDGGEVGHMQLVDSKIHQDTRHTGGIAIWGNKSKYT